MTRNVVVFELFFIIRQFKISVNLNAIHATTRDSEKAFHF